MRSLFLFLLLLAGLLPLCSQSLEIHQMSVGAADAGVIVVRNVAELRLKVAALGPPTVPDINAVPGTELLKIALQNKVDLTGTVEKVILIDAAEKSPRYANKIHEYLKEIGVGDSLDYVVLSHLDRDHYGGFKDLFEKFGYTVLNTAYHPNITTAGYPKPSPTCRKGFFNQDSIAGKMRIAKVNETEIDLGAWNGKNIKLTCVVADCYALGQDPADPAQSNCPGSNDSNDHSIGWILQYGAFRFYTGGDLNGLLPKFPIETAMVDSLEKRDPARFTQFGSGADIPKGHTCAIKINHHGSDNSTNAHFLSVLNPKVAFVSCGYQHQHPRPGVISDLDTAKYWNVADWVGGVQADGSHLKRNSLAKFYLTALLKGLAPVVDSVGIPPSKGVIGGDLVMIVDDNNIATQSRFAVYYNGRVSSVLEGKDGKDPNDKNVGGLEVFECHKAKNLLAQDYITNH